MRMSGAMGLARAEKRCVEKVEGSMGSRPQLKVTT